MIKWFVKKYIMGHVNGLIHVNQENIINTKNTIDTWIGRLEKILQGFKSMLQRLDDGKIDDDELEDTIQDVSDIIRNW